ncbi:cupin domain-containing protein [Phytohabitans rumicis]|uniref:Cupin n=1 Tax=Phytohabitans rumicis TaxID=1076125 RepID=A0A6V8KVE4_9ACTN|nr:cupin domain-containing protein [Phytohabitans rumicis]GFJ87794.1 cupin [Phytohabitans rumicis]
MSAGDGNVRTGRVRRVVTGIDEQGRSVILSDGEAPNVFRSPTVPGFGAVQVWTTAPGPVRNDGAADAAGADVEIPMYPPLGGTVFRVADFPPDTAYGEVGKDQLFSDIGGEHARDGATHSGDRHFWFHKTDSIDFGVVLEGEIWMLLDEGECLLRAGDVIVQRGTAHSWSNRSGKPCRIAFLLLGALPVAGITADEETFAQWPA